MGLQLPGWLTEPLGWIGMTWPEADEEKLFEAGQQWLSFGSQLSTIAQRADQTASEVWSANEGAAVDAFREWWTRDDGPEPRLTEDSMAAEIIGAALIIFAALTLALKIAFIVQLVILAIEVAQAIATAIATFGATAAEVPGFIVATRAICRQLVKQVVEHVRTVIEDIFEKAKGLLKKVESKLASRAERRAARQLEEDLAKKITSGPTMPTKDLLPGFEHEHLPNSPPFFSPSGVRRLSEAEREELRVFVDQDGLLRRSDGTLFDTRGSNTHWGGANSDRAIFVMDEHGNVYASKFQERGVFHHSTLANGDPVAGAGELHVENGKLLGITDQSGHYRPLRANTQNVINNLAGRGVDMNGVNVQMGAPR